MAYTNKVTEVAVAIIAVLILAVAIGPQRTEAQSVPDAVCALAIPEIVNHCYLTGSLVPTDECCNDLKTASKTEVSCLCDNIIANPSNGNITRALFDSVNDACEASDKFACDGGKGGDANSGTTSKIAASMGIFGLVASFFF